jgi:hypothetical protein
MVAGQAETARGGFKIGKDSALVIMEIIGNEAG